MKRRGMALPAAVFALVVLSLLIAAALQTGHLEQRLGRGMGEAQRAFEAAEAELVLVLGAWESLGPLHALAVGDSVELPPVPLDRRTGAGAVVRRVADSLFLITAEGLSTDATGNVLARRVLARVVRSRGDAAFPLPQRSWMQVY